MKAEEVGIIYCISIGYKRGGRTSVSPLELMELEALC